jgi:nickel transport protein
MRRRWARAAALSAALLGAAPGAARAHEVLHEVERGRAVAVRVYEADGDPLAGAAWEVFSPSEPGAPHQAGRTGRNGWLAFVPDAPGAWRLRVVEAGGHGLDVPIDVGPSAGAPARRGALARAAGPAAGALAIAAIFAAAYALKRRGRAAP